MFRIDVTHLSEKISWAPDTPIRVGKGSAFVVGGHSSDAGRALAGLRAHLETGDGRFDALSPQAVRTRVATHGRWWAIVDVPPIVAPSRLRLVFDVPGNGAGPGQVELGTIGLEPGLPRTLFQGRSIARAWGERNPSIAICLATYDPPRELFRRQIESIRTQTFEDWVCIVTDDGSSAEVVAEMRAELDDDPRFIFVEGSSHLGPYGNFERALALVPDWVDYVALADQDDRWYPSKLAELRHAIEESGAALAYSDMRIVDDSDRVLSQTYWRHRRNNSTDLATLMVGNTVTGAAALLRREVLEYALPFPPRIGRAFHDHWVASVAMALGGLAYVNRPLYDYVQHPRATFGFAAANGYHGAGETPIRDLVLRARRLGSRLAKPGLAERYFDDYLRIALAARVIEVRCAERMSAERLRVVRRLQACDDSAAAFAWLAARATRTALWGHEPMGVDRSAVAGLLWRRAAAV